MPSDGSPRPPERRVVSRSQFTATAIHSVLLGVAIGAVGGAAVEDGHLSVALCLGALFVGVTVGTGVGRRLTSDDAVLDREPLFGLGAFALALTAVVVAI